MIKKITLLTAATVLIVTIVSFVNNGNFAFSYSSGSQGAGYSGSPGDGNTVCATGGCHSSSSTVTGWITSNIPGTGYVPGTAYTITLTMTGGSHAFELTSEKSGGTKVGTFSSISGCTLYNSNHAVVANSMVSLKNITWTAPAAGNGSVTFYGCFASSSSNAKKCTYTVNEYSVGLNENSNSTGFSIYPNPVKDKIEISYTLETASEVIISLYSIDGKKVDELTNSDKNSGSYKESYDLKSVTKAGIYVLELKYGERSLLEKIIIE
jgi:hypothetical protein